MVHIRRLWVKPRTCQMHGVMIYQREYEAVMPEVGEDFHRSSEDTVSADDPHES